MMERKLFSAMMVVLLLGFGVNSGVSALSQALSIVDNFRGDKLEKTNRIIGRSIDTKSSWNRGILVSSEIAAAKGEVTEDCLLYGICSDDDDGQDSDGQGDGENNS